MAEPLPDTGMMPIADTRREVAEQPEVVARVLRDQAGAIDALAAMIVERGLRRLLASGSGDSWFAAQAARLAVERYAALPYEALQAYEYAIYGHPDEASVTHLIISSSGRPTTTWDALDRALAAGALVVGITDNPAADNPFVSRPTVVLLPAARKVGWPTQTTTATIALLLDLAIALGAARGTLRADEATALRAELRTVPERMATLLDRCATWAGRVAEQLEGRVSYLLVGSGPNYAVAQIGAALLAEGPQRPATALAVEEFHHALRIATLAPGDPAIVIAAGGPSQPRALDTLRSLRAWGARPVVLLAGDEPPEPGDLALRLPEVAEPFSPLLTLIPLHLLSLALAERRVAAGHQRPATVP